MIDHLSTDDAIAIARDLARHDSPKFASIGRRLLSIKKDEDLVTAVKLCTAVVSALK